MQCPPKPRSWIKGHESKRFCFSGFNNLPDVDPHRRVDELQLIDQGDVHTAKDVFQKLGRFGNATG